MYCALFLFRRLCQGVSVFVERKNKKQKTFSQSVRISGVICNKKDISVNCFGLGEILCSDTGAAFYPYMDSVRLPDKTSLLPTEN